MTVNVSLTPHLDAFILDTVASGRHQSASEVVRTALRLLEDSTNPRPETNGCVRKSRRGWTAAPPPPSTWRRSSASSASSDRLAFDKILKMRYSWPMNPDIDTSQLSPAECILLAEQLWEQARNHPEAVPIPPEHLKELHRRAGCLRTRRDASGPAVGGSRCLARNPVTLRIIIENPAKADLAAAVKWYKQIQKGLEADFRLCVCASLHAIARHPESYPVLGRICRRINQPLPLCDLLSSRRRHRSRVWRTAYQPQPPCLARRDHYAGPDTNLAAPRRPPADGRASPHPVADSSPAAFSLPPSSPYHRRPLVVGR